MLVYSSAVTSVQCAARNADAVSPGLARSLSVIVWSLGRLSSIYDVSLVSPSMYNSPNCVQPTVLAGDLVLSAIAFQTGRAICCSLDWSVHKPSYSV